MKTTCQNHWKGGLNQMCPTFSINDSEYLALANSESSGQQRHCLTSRSMKLAYLFDLFFCQLAFTTALFASCATVSCFGNHVKVVVSCSSEEQMRWVATRSVVAFVANIHARWNSAIIGEHPCVPVCIFGFIFRTKAEPAISGYKKTASPWPTFIGRFFCNSFPKSSFGRDFRSWHDVATMYTLH